MCSMTQWYPFCPSGSKWTHPQIPSYYIFLDHSWKQFCSFQSSENMTWHERSLWSKCLWRMKRTEQKSAGREFSHVSDLGDRFKGKEGGLEYKIQFSSQWFWWTSVKSLTCTYLAERHLPCSIIIWAIPKGYPFLIQTQWQTRQATASLVNQLGSLGQEICDAYIHGHYAKVESKDG